MHTKKPANSEVDAYSYIKDQLSLLGWMVKNPARFAKGEVYKQNEALANLEIKAVLNRDMPEAIVMVSHGVLWVLESKREKTQRGLEEAIKDLKDQYAKKINKSGSIKCVFISAVAGNDSDGYLISNQYLHNGEWKEIIKNGFQKTSLLSRDEIENILAKDQPLIDDRIEFSEEKYLKTAEQINETLHLSAINKSKRARFIAGMVLSFAAGTEVNIEVKDTTILVDSVNSLIRSVLKSKGKEDFYNFISLQLPPNEDNHIKYRDAIVQTYTQLKNLDIRSAMNSGNDILGKFYEVFLKYGNGAKEIGIVLTPRHITSFAAEVLDVRHNDIVFDPTCGTGGFLVAGLDYVKTNATESQLDNFKRNNIFGVEQEDDVVALALVNMIFRGDGRNNIKEGNAFNNNLRRVVKDGVVTAEYYNSVDDLNHEHSERPITKIMMNPPFALKKGDEQEYHFIDYALEQMEDGGILFAILPISVLVEGPTKSWRQNVLLKNNTLLAVVTFPNDLFYPVGVNTVGLFVKKGIPHKWDQNVYFARAISDGFLKKKGKRLYNVNNPNYLEAIKPELKAFLQNPTLLKVDGIPELKKACPLDPHDTYAELVAEAYIDSRVPTTEELEEGVDTLVRETASFLIKNRINDDEYYS